MHPMSHARKQNYYTTKYSIREHAWKICLDVNARDLSPLRKRINPRPFPLSHFTFLI